MKRIKLTQGYEALVDDSDYELVNQYKWYPHHNGNRVYARAWINGKFILMHRFLLGIKDQPEIKIDHIDGNGANNQKCNLRVATHAENLRNSRKGCLYGGRPITSKYKGVTWDKQTGRWRAQVTFNCKTIHLGLYDIEENAAKAYNRFAEEHYGEFTRLNVVDDCIELPERSMVNRRKRLTYGGRPTSSKYKGVHWCKRERRWRAMGQLNFKRVHLGYFDTEEAAARAYNKFVIENFGEFARLNKVNRTEA